MNTSRSIERSTEASESLSHSSSSPTSCLRQQLIVTAASSDFVESLMNMISSIQIWAADSQVIVYDIGLTDSEKQKISSWCNIVEIRTLFGPERERSPPKGERSPPNGPNGLFPLNGNDTIPLKPVMNTHGNAFAPIRTTYSSPPLPAHFRELGHFAWKPWIMHEVAIEFGCILWFDSGVELHGSLHGIVCMLL